MPRGLPRRNGALVLCWLALSAHDTTPRFPRERPGSNTVLLRQPTQQAPNPSRGLPPVARTPERKPRPGEYES